MKKMSGVFSPSSIDRISDHRVAEVLEMNTNLVGASCPRLALHQRCSALGCQYSIMGEGLTSPLYHCHFLAVDGMSANSGLDFPMGHAGRSAHKRKVGLFDIAGCELRGDVAVGDFCLCHNEATRCLFVEAVNDTWSFRASHYGNARAMVQQRVCHGSLSIASAGMDDQSRRLVDHEQRFILE